MQDETYRAIQVLLASNDPAELMRGLNMALAEAFAGSPRAVDRLCQTILPLFYIDTLDHPEHLPVLEAAIDVVASMGEPVIPVLIENLEAGDVKAQMAMAQALGRMGPKVIAPLMEAYRSGCGDPACHSFLLFALGKVKSPEILVAAPIAAEAAASPDLELRDTATRAIGKFAESIPAGALSPELHDAFLLQLQDRLADHSPGVRAKAVRSLGKLAHYGHLTSEECAGLKITLQRIVGGDANYEWDRAYVVRKEAQEAMGYLGD